MSDTPKTDALELERFIFEFFRQPQAAQRALLVAMFEQDRKLKRELSALQSKEWVRVPREEPNDNLRSA